MKNACDLHTHSCFSDGTCTPAELIDQAVTAGLSALALTDHNTVAGLSEFAAAAEGKPILPIPGVEISTGWMGKELHILGLFLKPEDHDAVTAFLDTLNVRKEESNRKLVQTLTAAGYPLSYEAICRAHPAGTVNRAVIAAALLEQGYVSSVEEAFQRLLHRRNGYYVPPERLCAFEAIGFLSSIGAVPVLAHPFLNLSEAELRSFLQSAKKHGLAAMETVYSSYSEETAQLAQQIAAQFGLLPSGGSDFHGENKPEISLGTGRGSLYVPAQFALQLQEAAGK